MVQVQIKGLRGPANSSSLPQPWCERARTSHVHSKYGEDGRQGVKVEAGR